jgi:hypothetical protein
MRWPGGQFSCGAEPGRALSGLGVGERLGWDGSDFGAGRGVSAGRLAGGEAGGVADRVEGGFVRGAVAGGG